MDIMIITARKSRGLLVQSFAYCCKEYSNNNKTAHKSSPNVYKNYGSLKLQYIYQNKNKNSKRKTCG